MTFNNSNELKEYLKCQEDLYCPALELFVTVSANWIVCSMKCSLPEAKESVYLSLKNRTYSLPHTAFVNTDLFEINDFCGKYFNKEWMSWPDFSDSVLINDTKNGRIMIFQRKYNIIWKTFDQIGFQNYTKIWIRYGELPFLKLAM